MPGGETFSPFFAADIRTPFFSAAVLKKCALIGMHQTAEEGRVGTSGCRTPDFRRRARNGCPQSPIWESEDEAWSEDESVSSSVSRENTVCNAGCMGLVTGSVFVEDWELVRVALSCHIAMDMLCQEMDEAW